MKIRLDKSLGNRVIRIDGRNLSQVTVDQAYEHREHVDDYMSQLTDCQPQQEATALISLGIS